MKARNFREIKGMAYTRRKYMRGIPGSKIVKFTMGNPNGEFSHTLELVNLIKARSATTPSNQAASPPTGSSNPWEGRTSSSRLYPTPTLS